MAKSKQDKFTEKLRQTQVNTFSDGLNMDLHPLTTPNTILTDCVNGTMITYNDNEFVLQNDRGNTKIEGAKLNPGFIPIGMKEHNGILYIVSHNPQTKESEIGTYPSPVNMESQEISFKRSFNVADSKNLKYADFENTEISYYDDTMITQYDTYKLDPPDNPLVVLDHYVLTDGKTHKLNLLENGRYSFESPGEGILGYKYRSFQIDSIDMSYEAFNNIINLKLKAISTDEYLFDKYSNYKFKYDISVNLISSDDTITNTIINMTKDIDWNYIYQLENFNKIEIPFSTSEYKYDEDKKNITYDGQIYDKIEINITPKVEKDGYTYTFDNLEKNIKILPSELFNHKTFFSKFKYHFNNENNLEIEIEFDTQKYDINGDINYSFELTDLEESINTKSLNDKQNLVYNFDSTFTWTKKSISINDTPLKISQEYQCKEWSVIQKPTYYKYNINSDDSLTIQLLDANLKIIDEKTTCTSTIIDTSTGKFIGISEVSADKNKIYLGTLSFDFKTSNNTNVSDITNFIIITDDSMLSRYWDSDITRMDEILFEDWYTKKYNKDKKNYEDTNYLNCNLSNWSSSKFVNQSKYNNTIDFNKIKNTEYQQEFWLKFKTFYPTKNINELENEIPKIGKYYNAEYVISNTCPTSCNIKMGNKSVNSYSADIKLERSWSLIKSEHNKEDIYIRKYLYTLMENTVANSFSIGNYVAFRTPILGGISSYGIRINNKIYSTTTDFSIGENITSTTYKGWEVKDCEIPGIRKNKTCYFVIGDDSKNGYWTNKILNGNGIERGSIKISGNNVKYDGETDNLWMRWQNDKSKLMLVGQKYHEAAEKTYAYYLHHLYITENIGECVQFTYNKEELKNIRTEQTLSYSIIPIHKELNSIKNIQSINNLIPMKKTDKISYDESNETDKSFFKDVENFLKNLASNITKWDQVSKEGLQNDLTETQYSYYGSTNISMECPNWEYVNGQLIFTGAVQEKTIKLGCDYIFDASVGHGYNPPEETLLVYEGKIIPEISWNVYEDYYSLKYYKCMEYGA